MARAAVRVKAAVAAESTRSNASPQVHHGPCRGGTEDAPQETEPPAADENEIDENGGGEGGTGDDGTGYEPDSAAGTAKTVVDAYGRAVEIPENVGSVAAVGELAVMVLMLSGAEQLAATNAGLASDATALRAFDGLFEIPALWSGGGSYQLGDAELETLCEIHPDVVLETSGSATFNDAQVERLQSKGTLLRSTASPRRCSISRR